MKLTKAQTDFMRADLESNFGYTKMIEITRKRFKEEGRDFEKEYNEWKES